MIFFKYTPMVFALIWCAEETKSANIFLKPIERAGDVFTALANISLDAAKTALDVVETGIDVTIETRNMVVDRIKNAIENFRKQMGAGIGELGIPKLDPLEIKHLEFHVDHEIGKFNGSVDNVTVLDLSLFSINNIVYTLPLRVNINITFPTVRVDGAFYDINGLIGEMFRIHGKGPFNLTLINLNVEANTTLEYKNVELVMKDLSLDVILEGMKCNFQNLMGGGDNEITFNKVIGELAPAALKAMWPELKPIVTKRIKKVSNELLKKVDVSYIFPLKYNII